MNMIAPGVYASVFRSSVLSWISRTVEQLSQDETKEKTCQCEGVIPVLQRQVAQLVVKCLGPNDKNQERWEFTCDENGNGKKDKREPSEIVVMKSGCKFESNIKCDVESQNESNSQPTGCQFESALRQVVGNDIKLKCL